MKRLDVIVLSIALSASSLWCLSAGSQLGATTDEPFYIREGLNSWRTGSNKELMTKGTMPLPIDVQTLLFYLREAFSHKAYDPISDLPELLPQARQWNLLFWGLLLIYAWKWGRHLGSPAAGRWAVAFVASEPNLLAHATLATTDIALTAMLLVAVYHFDLNRNQRWCKRVAWPGFWFGMALATKASALPYVPMMWLVFGLAHIERPRWNGNLWHWLNELRIVTSRLRWDIVQMGVIGLFVVFTYVGSDWVDEPTFVEWANKLPEGKLRELMVPLSRNLPIFPNAGEGLVQQIKHNFRGHGPTFLLGNNYREPVWYYFPITLSIKFPTPMLLLLGYLLFTRWRSFGLAGIAALVLLLFSLNARVQIGVRLLFPCEVFLLIAMSRAIVSPRRAGGASIVERSAARRGETIQTLAAAVAVLLTIVETLLCYPDTLRYQNAFWGGPPRGVPTLLIDSNYDWGQGVPELQQWVRANGARPTYVWYYGADPQALMPPTGVMQIHAWPKPTPEELRAKLGDAYLAVSTTFFIADENRWANTLPVIRQLESQEPFARTRYFNIYHPASMP